MIACYQVFRVFPVINADGWRRSRTGSCLDILDGDASLRESGRGAMSTSSEFNEVERSRVLIAAVFPIAVAIGVVAILYAARDVLGPYVFGLLMAYLLLPIVRKVESILPDSEAWRRVRRPTAVLGTAAAALTLVILFVGLLFDPIIDGTRDLLANFGVYWSTLHAENDTFRDWHLEFVPADVRARIDGNASVLGESMLAGVAGILDWLFVSRGSVVSTASAAFAVPLFVIYYLLNENETQRRLREQMPDGWVADLIAGFRICDRILSSYVRGVVTGAVIVGTITGLGYWLIGVNGALALGAIAFGGKIIPIIGPWIAFLITFPVIWATQPDRAVAAIVLFVIIQLLEVWFLQPRAGGTVDMTAAGTIVLLAIGGGLAGGTGVLFALPVAAMLRALCVYISQRLGGKSPQDAITYLRMFRVDPPGPSPIAESAESS